MARTHRIEHDFLGEKEIFNDCYYGVQTLRAMENFPITGHSHFIGAGADLVPGPGEKGRGPGQHGAGCVAE